MLCLIAVVCIDQKRVHRSLATLRGLNKEDLSRNTSKTATLLWIVVALIASAKFLVVVDLRGATALIAGGAAAFLVGRTIVQSIRQHNLERAALKGNPALQLRRWEEQLLVFLILPLIAARLISGLGLLVEEISISDRITLFATSMVLLGMLKPRREHFATLCTRCKQPVPVVLATIGSCWRCDPKIAARN